MTILVLCTIALLAPFLDKPFHIDEPLFVWAGKNLHKNWYDFFGFDVNWNGFLQKMHEVTQNPPLACYYLAAAAKLGGSWNERWLHAACLLPATGTVLGTWALARRQCERPLLASLIVATSPVFLISASSVMCDVLMTCLWMWAIVLWISGLEQNSHWRLALSGLLVGAAALTKYFGLSLLPLLGLYTIVRRGRFDWRLLWLLIPVACLVGYETWTHHLYGRGLITGASQFVSTRYFGHSNLPAKSVASLAFTGGCLICLPFFLPRLFRRGWTWLAVIVSLAGLTIGFHVWNPTFFQPHPSRPASWDITFQAALLVMIGIGVLWLTTNELRSTWRTSRSEASDVRRDQLANSVLLTSWLIGTLLFAGVVNWTVNGRSVLPLIPAAAIVLCRTLDRVALSSTPGLRSSDFSHWFWSNPQSVAPALLLIPATIVALLVTHADYRFASTQREAAQSIMSVARPGKAITWFAGHWGFQYYMESLGGIALEYPSYPLEPGDLFALPLNNDTQYNLPEGAEFVNRKKLKLSPWAATNQPIRCAGFYNSEGGVLPFVLGSEFQTDPRHTRALQENHLDTYHLVRIIQPVEVRPKWMTAPISGAAR